MFPVRHLKRSIGLTQAVLVPMASLVIGLGLSALLLAHTFSQHRGDALRLCEEILTLAEGGATSAAYTLDPTLARGVVNSIAMARGVELAVLRDENSLVLASRQVAPSPAPPITRWFASTFLGSPLSAKRALFDPKAGGDGKVGTLFVQLSAQHVATGFVTMAQSTVLVTVVTALLVGVLLLVMSSRLLTSPLRRVATRIAELDPENPGKLKLSVPRGHEHNELGELIRRTNDMLGRLASSQEQLRHLATRDPLTDLPNRSLIGERLGKAIARARRRDGRLAVLFLDLDRFKTINDSLGHDVGDELLCAVAGALAGVVRANDSVGRLGGDEFVVILEDLEDARSALTSLQRIVGAFTGPFQVGQTEVRSTASVGIAVFPEDGEDAQALMRHADLAMYKAKHAGGGRWQFFAPEMGQRVDARLRTEMALAAALERGELTVLYQAKVSAVTGELDGCEALLRWDHEGQRLEASEFIQVAEDTGLILAIGDWVIDEVCRQIAHWRAKRLRVPVAVNVSARQLAENGIINSVLDAARRHDIDPTLLSLEITETVLMEDPEHGAELLRTLTGHGIQVSIDDFGTGYASLAYLTQLPVDTLKIDRSFVSDVRKSSAILETIVAMARALGLKTIAEGVETEQDRVALRRIGCDVLQGYFIGRPLEPEEFERAHVARSHMDRAELGRTSLG